MDVRTAFLIGNLLGTAEAAAANAEAVAVIAVLRVMEFKHLGSMIAQRAGAAKKWPEFRQFLAAEIRPGVRIWASETWVGYAANGRTARLLGAQASLRSKPGWES